MDVVLTVVLPLALAFIMFSLGLGLRVSDFARVVMQPKAVAAGLTAQLLVAPLAAVGLLWAFSAAGRPLPPELAVGMVILALCPGGVTSNLLTSFARGRVALSVTLTAVASLASIVTLPFVTAWAVDAFLGDAAPEVDVTGLALTMAAITAAPVALGVAARALVPRVAERMQGPASTLAAALFAIILVGALAANWDVFTAQIGLLGPLLVAFNLVLLGVGLLIAGALRLPREDAVAISLEAGVQNGTLGIAVGALLVEASAGLPAFSLPAGVYGVTMYLVTLPAVALMRALGARRTRAAK